MSEPTSSLHAVAPPAAPKVYHPSAASAPAARLGWPADEALADQRRFLTQVWLRAWAEHLPRAGRWAGPLRILTAQNGAGEVSAVLPLASLRLLPGVSLPALAGPRQPFRGIPVNREGLAGSIEQLAEQILADRRLPALRLSSVLGQDAAVDTLVSYLRLRGWMVHERFLYLTLATPLPQSMAALYEQLGKRSEKRKRERESRLKREGGYQIRVYTGLDGAQARKVVAELADIERRSWLLKQDGDTQFQTEEGRAFWQTILSHPTDGRAWRVFILTFKDQPAAYDVCVDAGRTRYVLCGHYDDAYKPLSLGTTIDLEVFRDAIDNKLACLDFGHGDSGYKQRTLGALPAGTLRDVVVASPTAKGRAFFAASTAWTLADEWRRAREAMTARKAESTA